MNDVIQRNKSTQTDSDGFMLGARLSQLHELDRVLHSLRSISNPTADMTEDISSFSSLAKTYANDVRALQKKLGIDDAALAEAQTIFNQAAALASIRQLLSSY
jgi:hypothetical protein